MNQSSNLNEFVIIAKRKFPFSSIIAFNSAEVWSNSNFLMNHYSRHCKPLKGTKTFHHIEIVKTKFMCKNLLSSGWPCQSFSANENKDKSKFIEPECGKFYQGVNFSVQGIN